MRFGFAVKVLAAGGMSSHDTRRWPSGPHLAVSLDRLETILGTSRCCACASSSPPGLAPERAPSPDVPSVAPA